MFVDALEVEENIRMSRKLLEHSRNDGGDKELNLVELHETKQTFSWKPTPFSSRHKEDRYDDEKVGNFTSLFPKYCE